jgi:hypothetical protein
MSKQTRFLAAIAERLRAIEDTDSDVITHRGYQWKPQNIKCFGTIPKLTFAPYGQSVKIKADIMRSAGLEDKDRQKEIDEIRAKFSPKQARDNENRILARLFESYWNSYWQTIFRALRRIEQAQRIFAKPTETISKPMRILLGKRAINGDQKLKTPESPEFRDHKPYSAILSELE